MSDAATTSSGNVEGKSNGQDSASSAQVDANGVSNTEPGTAKENVKSTEKSEDTKPASTKLKPDDAEVDIKDLTKLKLSYSRINYITIDEYSKRHFSVEKPHNAIDAIVTEDWPGAEESLKLSIEQRQQAEPIRFLQINSPPLWSIIQQINGSGASSFRAPRIMLAPFKHILYHEHEFEEHARKLKNLHANAPSLGIDLIGHRNLKGEEQDESKTAQLGGADLQSNSLKALYDLECLLAWYRWWIQPRWHWLRYGKPASLAFRDLTLLFQPGDLLYVPQEKHRLFRVFKVTDGRPKINYLFADDYRSGLESDTSVYNGSRAPTSGATVNTTKWVDLHLDCYFLDYDGRDVGAVHFAWMYKAWSGRKETTSLKALPLRLASDVDGLTTHFRSTGCSFLEACRIKVQYYEGRSHADRPIKETDRTYRPGAWSQWRPLLLTREPPNPEDVASQVVVDFERCFQVNERWKPDFSFEPTADHHPEVDGLDYLADIFPRKSVRCMDVDEPDAFASEILRGRDDWLQSPGKKPMDVFRREAGDDIMLLPETVVGYCLRTRLWVFLDLRKELWKDVEANEQAWNELQLPSHNVRVEHKRALASLVERHFNTKKLFASQSDIGIAFDLIHGKGLGLIILLHGPPGVGKTSTAEAIAEKYGKPLLPITCGGLGLDAEKVETALTRTFQLAQAWDCIVLLDEADVFMAQRDKKDLQRNALVSVFLRALEYYTGVLFLTTNRIGTFDEALRSRIHVALFYPHLDLEQTQKIWQTNLDRWRRHKLDKNQPLKVEEEGQDIIGFGIALYEFYKARNRTQWNGRQIRNSFQTAVALAEYEANKLNEKDPDKKAQPNLSVEHFRMVAAASEDFEKYLKDTRKWYDDEYAYDNDLRAQYLPGTTVPIKKGQRPRDTNENLGDDIFRLQPKSYDQVREHAPVPGPYYEPRDAGVLRKGTFNDLAPMDPGRDYINSAQNSARMRMGETDAGAPYGYQNRDYVFDRTPRDPYGRQPHPSHMSAQILSHHHDELVSYQQHAASPRPMFSDPMAGRVQYSEGMGRPTSAAQYRLQESADMNSMQDPRVDRQPIDSMEAPYTSRYKSEGER
jgi:hypothetical protein